MPTVGLTKTPSPESTRPPPATPALASAKTENLSFKKELLFIQLLEGLCAEEAEFLVAVVNKKVNNKYKGFTANLVKEAFNWDDNFMKQEKKPSFPV